METIRKLFEVLSARERRQALLLLPMILVMAAAEVVSVAAVAPFLSLVVDPTAARTSPILHSAFTVGGFADDHMFLFAVGIAIIVVLITSNALLTGGYWVLYRFGSTRNHTIARRLLATYLRQPYSYFLEHNTATMSNNILQEVQQVVNGVLLPSVILVSKSAAILAILAFVVYVNPLLAAIVTLTLGGAYGVLSATTRRYLGRIGAERVNANQARHRATQEALGAIKEVRVAGAEEEMVRRFARPSRRFSLYQAYSQILSTVPRYALEGVAFSSLVVAALALLLNGFTRSKAVPVLGLYAFAGTRLLPALRQGYAALTQLRYSGGALDEVHRMLVTNRVGAYDFDNVAPSVAVARASLEGRIEIRDVSFCFRGVTPTLDGVSMSIPAHTCVAIVGATGAGKSTLVDILLGLLEPSGGTVAIDDVPLQGIATLQWQHQIGYVPQSIYLTDDTVKHNIAFGVPPAAVDMDAVRRAAKLACIDMFIERDLADGYDTTIGERGARLSGGQRQRLGLARALYHDPAVLFLDEATSALDTATESMILSSLARFPVRKTIVMIAHRLSAIEHCDLVFVLDHGRVAASGTYEDLLSREPAFQSIVSPAGYRHDAPQ